MKRVPLVDGLPEFLLLFAGFALPPKIVERKWDLTERERLFATSKASVAWKIEVIDPQPSPSGLMQLDRGRDELSWPLLSGAGSQHLNMRTRAKHQKTFAPEERAWAPFVKPLAKQSVRRGTWEILKGALYFVPSDGDGQPLWSLPMGDELVSVSVDKDRSSWMGLSAYPNRLFHMFWIPSGRRDEALLEVLDWGEGSEVVAWVSCAEGRSVLLENREDKVYLNFLRENSKLRTMEWEGHSEIPARWATGMLARTCTEIYLSSLGGILRVTSQ